MNKIQALPEEVINKIAAGEIVERPANVVKELLENSIDADASHINVEFELSGKKYMRITDDGCGMSSEDAVLSVERHTTSKISQFEDLSKIVSLGFRGEALPSIASVSRLKLATRTADAVEGWEIVIEGGKLKHSRQAGIPVGTTVEVSDLFFNTPARKKFLKSDYTERFHILHTTQELAISHYDIGFNVTDKNKKLLSSPPAAKPDERIMDIFGEELYSGLLYFKTNYGTIDIKGFISRIEHSQPNKNLQYFYVNNRPVTNRTLSHALYEAYSDSLPVGRHPAAIVFLQLNPSEIDINVHPTKRTVKFSNERDLHDLLCNTFRKYLTKQDLPVFHLPETAPEQTTYRTEPSDKYEQTKFISTDKESYPYRLESKDIFSSEVTVLGQLYDTYILAQVPSGLIIIDQHAANERILYENYKNQIKTGVPQQEMLIPEKLELSPHEDTVFKNILERINSMGFNIEEFGKNTYVIKSYPAPAGEIKHIKEFVREFIDMVINGFRTNQQERLEPEEKIIRAACRAAVKARDKLSKEEIKKLIKNLKDCSQPMCCPHGRPTVLHISQRELENKFRRT